MLAGRSKIKILTNKKRVQLLIRLGGFIILACLLLVNLINKIGNQGFVIGNNSGSGDDFKKSDSSGLLFGSKKRNLKSKNKSLNNQPYLYPVKPGSDEWNVRVENEGPVALCQIPSEILDNLATEALVRTCLSFPLRGDILAFNSPKEGLEMMKERFNGLREMYNRDDSKSVLVSVFSELNSNNVNPKADAIDDINEQGHIAGVVDVFFLTTILESLAPEMDDAQKSKITSKAVALLIDIQRDEPSASEAKIAVLAAEMLMLHGAEFIDSNGKIINKESLKESGVASFDILIQNDFEKFYELIGCK